jgi:hypothetical protein
MADERNNQSDAISIVKKQQEIQRIEASNESLAIKNADKENERSYEKFKQVLLFHEKRFDKEFNLKSKLTYIILFVIVALLSLSIYLIIIDNKFGMQLFMLTITNLGSFFAGKYIKMEKHSISDINPDSD